MTTKINGILLRKNKTVERRKINPDQPFIKVRGNLYTTPKEAVNLIVYEDQPNNPHSELIYVEGNPIPICTQAEVKADLFLEKLVIENALRSAGEPKGFFLEILGDYLKSPGKLLMLTFVGIIIMAVLGGFLKLW